MRSIAGFALAASLTGCTFLLEPGVGLECDGTSLCPEGLRCLEGKCAVSKPVCGDYEVLAPEECDEGKVVRACAYGETSCRVCNAQCRYVDGVTSFCGDGRTDEANGEGCDQGSGNSDVAPGACRSDCQPAICGDRVVDPAEACDAPVPKGNVCPYGATSCQNCSSCSLVAGVPTYCGDGWVDTAAGEQCEPDTSNANCLFCSGPPAFTRVVTLDGSTCGLDTAGAVRCWGPGGFMGTLSPGESFSAIDGGYTYACGLRASDGTVQCWGTHGVGVEPTPPTGRMTALSVGAGHSCAIRADGTLACWGPGMSDVGTPPSGTYKAVSAGVRFSCAITTGGALSCFGADAPASVPGGAFVSIATAFGGLICGLTDSGQVVCNGGSPPAGVFSRLSATLNGDTVCALDAAGNIVCWGFAAATRPGPYVDVSVSVGHACGVRAGGSVDCWGSDTSGQLAAPLAGYTRLAVGQGSICVTDSTRAGRCWGGGGQPAAGAHFTDIAVGPGFACGIVEGTGAISCWGPTPPTIGGTFTSIDSLGQDICGLTTSGSVYCWNQTQQWAPVTPALASLSVGSGFACGTKDDSSAVCWGAAPAAPPTGVGFVSVDAGFSHACGVTVLGDLRCWGTAFSIGSVPPGKFRQVSVSGSRSCAVRSDDDAIVCWGPSAKTPPTGRFGTVMLGPSSDCARYLSGRITCWNGVSL